MAVYITDLAAFLPNDPVTNEQMELLLGMVQQLPSRTRKVILRNNGITSRHYAIDPATGKTTHTNAQLTAEAVRRLKPQPDFTPDQIECLCCGTSSPDQLMPGHGSMVHGELQGKPCEVMSAAGICNAGMSAMKYGWMSVASGQSNNAVVTGSELASSYMRADFCGPVDQHLAAQLEERPVISFEADFLRWMLSDGAGAAFLTNQPAAAGISLRIDWIELLSFANELETCMYAGAVKLENGSLRGWREKAVAVDEGSNPLLIRQDVKLLNREIITTAVNRTLPGLITKHQLKSDQIDWFLPHYSSDYFRPALRSRMESIGFGIHPDRWFTNLAAKGNTGSASMYIILEELFHSGRLSKGEKLLCFIPESGRFSMCYMQLTVV